MDTGRQQEFQEILREIRQLRAELRAPEKRLLTVDETAHFLGLSPRTIRNGLGPRAQKPFPVKPVRVAGRVLFRLEDLDGFVAGLGTEIQAKLVVGGR